MASNEIEVDIRVVTPVNTRQFAMIISGDGYRNLRCKDVAIMHTVRAFTDAFENIIREEFTKYEEASR